MVIEANVHQGSLAHAKLSYSILTVSSILHDCCACRPERPQNALQAKSLQAAAARQRQTTCQMSSTAAAQQQPRSNFDPIHMAMLVDLGPPWPCCCSCTQAQGRSLVCQLSVTATLLQQITCVAGSGVFCLCHWWQPFSMQIPCAAAASVVAAACFVYGKAACAPMGVGAALCAPCGLSQQWQQLNAAWRGTWFCLAS
jgi:hypothetical protein